MKDQVKRSSEPVFRGKSVRQNMEWSYVATLRTLINGPHQWPIFPYKPTFSKGSKHMHGMELRGYLI